MRPVDGDLLVEIFVDHAAEVRSKKGFPVNELAAVCYERAANEVKNAPTIDAEPVVHGRWVEPVPGDGFPYCSNCKNIALDKGLFLNPKLMDWNLTPYCPHCGAKMDGGDRDG